MKILKIASIAALAATLIGCGHGYEGEYRTKIGSSNKLVEKFAGSMGVSDQSILVGSDYIESNGQRTTFDDIFVRESGDSEFLVFQSGDREEAWYIEDEDTLIQGSDFAKIKMVRVK